jgi:type III secretory pathway component EscS
MMFIEVFSVYLMEFMIAVIVLAGIPLGLATILGLIVSFLQAITQIQDQTLAQTVKIVAIVGVLLGSGSALVAPLMTSTKTLFTKFESLVE